MKPELEFDFDNVVDTEFLVTQGTGRTPDLDFVKTGEKARNTLVAAAALTWSRMQLAEDGPELYDPANDYGSDKCLYMPIDDPLAYKPSHLYNFGNPRTLDNLLDVLPKISLYCARHYDNNGRMLLGVKKTGDFGGRLKKPRLRIINAGLELDEEPEFQLADDFDFLVDGQNVFIHRHKSFENASNLQAAIKQSVTENIQTIAPQMTYVDFSIVEGASTGVREARLLAAIKTGNFCSDWDESYLLHKCDTLGISYSQDNGVIRISPEHNLYFLRVLARQYFEFETGPNRKETWYATNRRAIK